MRIFAGTVLQRSLAVPLVLLAASALARPLAAQAHGHEHEHGHAGGLHFVHPLIAESVSPDTKVRLDYLFQNPGSESEMELEGEYAFHPSFSVEAGVHFDPAAAELGETHLLFKFANYAFAERGVLLGHGLSLAYPLGAGTATEQRIMHTRTIRYTACRDEEVSRRARTVGVSAPAGTELVRLGDGTALRRSKVEGRALRRPADPAQCLRL